MPLNVLNALSLEIEKIRAYEMLLTVEAHMVTLMDKQGRKKLIEKYQKQLGVKKKSITTTELARMLQNGK
jgi:hypothetical protein